MITISGVSVAFGGRPVLAGVDFTLARGDKVALTGANGSGKTTLMRIMSGQLTPDQGQVIRGREIRVSYLPQQGARFGERTLLAEAEESFARGRRLKERIRTLEEALAGRDSGSPEVDRMLSALESLSEEMEASGYERRRERIERVLQGLRFRAADFGREAGGFSEGWQMRIALARVLLEDPDILLLDEPTNYLDLEAREWLEDFLQKFAGGFLAVSHDRYFLDVTVRAVAELYQGRLSRYPGNYSAYEQRRALELEQIVRAFQKQQEEIERLEGFIRRFRYNASKARLVQSRIRYLEGLERLQPPPAMKGIRFDFPAPPPSSRSALVLEEVSRSYGDLEVFSGLSLELKRGERLALVGPNGTGKSTLMRVMAGREEPSSGRVLRGSGVSVGYFSEELQAGLEDSASVVELVESWAPAGFAGLTGRIRALLGSFLFGGDDAYKPVSVLSGGERSRLALLRLLLQPANILFLDEPTNHLDMTSKEILLEALTAYNGALVFVSHDRIFLEALATRVLEIEAGRPRIYPGDYSYYLWRREHQGAGEAAEPRAKEPAPAPAPTLSEEARLKDKRLKRELNRLSREEEGILERLEALQGEALELEASMADPQVYRDGERMRAIKARLQENHREQGEHTSRWEELEASRRVLKED